MPLAAGFGFPLGGEAPTVPQQAALDALGVDILFVEGRTVIGPHGDYELVRGLENYRRSILHRLATSPGEYKVRPTYGAGLRAAVKKPYTTSLRDELRQRVIEQVLADDRTEAVPLVELEKLEKNGRPGLRVRVRAQVVGRTVDFQPFDFHQEA